LAHARRRIVHFAVAHHPTAEWAAQQIREAFPWDSAPRYLRRDRHRIYGGAFTEQIATFGIERVFWAPRSPWQTAYVERVIGTIRREYLDQTLFWTAADLEDKLRLFQDYFNRQRVHSGLEGRLPEPGEAQTPLSFASYRWRQHCRGHYQTPIAA